MKIEKCTYGLGFLVLSFLTSNSWGATLGKLDCAPQLTLTSGSIVRQIDLRIGGEQSSHTTQSVAPEILADGFSLPLEVRSEYDLPHFRSLVMSSSEIQGHVQIELEILYGETLGANFQLMAKFSLTHWNADSSEIWDQATLVSPLIMGSRVMLSFSSKQGNLAQGSVVCRLFP